MSKLSSVFASNLFPLNGRKYSDDEFADLARHKGEILFSFATEQMDHPEEALCACISAISELVLLQGNEFTRSRLIDTISDAIKEVSKGYETEYESNGPEADDEGEGEDDEDVINMDGEEQGVEYEEGEEEEYSENPARLSGFQVPEYSDDEEE